MAKVKRELSFPNKKKIRVSNGVVKQRVYGKDLILYGELDFSRQRLVDRLQEVFPEGNFYDQKINKYILDGKIPNEYGGQLINYYIHDATGIQFLRLDAPLDNRMAQVSKTVKKAKRK